MDDIGSRIYEERRKKRLSQEQLADLLKISNKAISKWENGESLPTIDNIVKLARIFGVSSDYLLGLEDGSKEESKTDLPETALPSKEGVVAKRNFPIDRMPALLFLHLLLPAVLLLLYALPLFTTVLGLQAYTCSYSVFVSQKASLAFFILLMIVFAGNIAFEFCGFFLPKIREKNADQIFSLLFVSAECLFNTVLFFLALEDWVRGWNAILTLIILFVPFIALGVEIYYLRRRYHAEKEGADEVKPMKVKNRFSFSSLVLFLLSLVFLLLVPMCCQSWEEIDSMATGNAFLFFPSYAHENFGIMVCGVFELCLDFLIVILFFVAFFSRKIWENRIFTFAQLSVFALFLLLSTIATSVSAALTTTQNITSLGIFLIFSFWILFLLDLFFVFLLPRIRKHLEKGKAE